MEKSIHEERYSVLKEALMHEFGERNINSSAMEEDNNIEFLIDWNHNTVSLMIGPVLENQDEYVVVSNVYGEAGTKVNIVIDGIDGIVSYDNLCNHIITKIRRKTMENEMNTKLRSLLSIRAKLNEVFKDEISWNENLPTEQGIMCFIYKCIIISITILNNGDIIISSNIGSGVVKLPSEAIDFIANMVKENGVYMRKNYKASFNAGKSPSSAAAALSPPQESNPEARARVNGFSPSPAIAAAPLPSSRIPLRNALAKAERNNAKRPKLSSRESSTENAATKPDTLSMDTTACLTESTIARTVSVSSSLCGGMHSG